MGRARENQAGGEILAEDARGRADRGVAGAVIGDAVGRDSDDRGGLGDRQGAVYEGEAVVRGAQRADRGGDRVRPDRAVGQGCGREDRAAGDSRQGVTVDVSGDRSRQARVGRAVGLDLVIGGDGQDGLADHLVHRRRGARRVGRVGAVDRCDRVGARSQGARRQGGNATRQGSGSDGCSAVIERNAAGRGRGEHGSGERHGLAVDRRVDRAGEAGRRGDCGLLASGEVAEAGEAGAHDRSRAGRRRGRRGPCAVVLLEDEVQRVGASYDIAGDEVERRAVVGEGERAARDQRPEPVQVLGGTDGGRREVGLLPRRGRRGERADGRDGRERDGGRRVRLAGAYFEGAANAGAYRDGLLEVALNKAGAERYGAVGDQGVGASDDPAGRQRQGPADRHALAEGHRIGRIGAAARDRDGIERGCRRTVDRLGAGSVERDQARADNDRGGAGQVVVEVAGDPDRGAERLRAARPAQGQVAVALVRDRLGGTVVLHGAGRVESDSRVESREGIGATDPEASSGGDREDPTRDRAIEGEGLQIEGAGRNRQVAVGHGLGSCQGLGAGSTDDDVAVRVATGKSRDGLRGAVEIDRTGRNGEDRGGAQGQAACNAERARGQGDLGLDEARTSVG